MSAAHSRTYQSLPQYLRSYVVEQDYARYTAREQATWRFIMRQARAFFKERAHPVYLQGLAASGIPISRIPNVEEMDAVLSKFGWGAVCVRGFIPPLAFLDFQARQVLPIAADMRSLEHVAYTPAPDIVHEAAGHAPIIADAAYAAYLTRYAQLARKAIFSREDLRLYEAIRMLSDVKENPDSTSAQIISAEQALDKAVAGITWLSEASKVARMNWWTVEYGLIGPLERPKIYGAGLLSSLSESRDCLGPGVEKRPLSLCCMEQSYDITKPQPQLYVAESFEHLTRVLAELESSMAFRQGGLASLALAKQAATLTSTELESGLTITGVLDRYEADEDKAPSFAGWSGPVQLSLGGCELSGHGRERHAHGFSTPLGPWGCPSAQDPSVLSERDLVAMGLHAGKKARLSFASGFEVAGRVHGTLHQNGRLILITWHDCTVRRAGKVYFEPAWGDFDMAVGRSVPSVYGGPGDWEAFGEYDLGKASSAPGRSSPFTPAECRLFELYGELRRLREDQAPAGPVLERRLAELAARWQHEAANEWLLAIELLEMVEQRLGKRASVVPWAAGLAERLAAIAACDERLATFVGWGLALVKVPD